MKNKLNVGICIDDECIPLWIFRVIDKIVHSESLNTKVILCFNRGYLSGKEIRYSTLYYWHEKLDHFFFRKGFDYDQLISLISKPFEVPSIRISIPAHAEQDFVDKTLYDQLLPFDLDILLNFSSVSVKNVASEMTRMGVMTYKLGDNRKIQGFSDGYWEIVKKMPEIGITINISMNPDNEPVTIYRSGIANYSNSLHINRDNLYELASMVIPRVLSIIQKNGPDYLYKLIKKYNEPVEIYNCAALKPPSSVKALMNIILIIVRSLYAKMNIVRLKWVLLYIIYEKNISFPLVLNKFKELRPPKGRFWADPFVLKRNDRYYIFVEEFIIKAKKAHITLLEIDEHGSLLQNIKIIDRPYHMSYPYVFEWEDNYYMIPEIGKSNSIDLFRCSDFPLKWDFEMKLMENIRAKDTTLFRYNHKWWLFTAVSNSPNNPNFNELYLFYTDNFLKGKWIPHPFNPVVSDDKTARPAGRIFMIEGRIFRPSQDCSGRYGKAFNINEITCLSESSYEEQLVTKVNATWEAGLKGTHTFNFDQNFVIIDAYRYKKRFF